MLPKKAVHQVMFSKSHLGLTLELHLVELLKGISDFIEDSVNKPQKQSTKSSVLGPPFNKREPLTRSLHAFYLSGKKFSLGFHLKPE